MSMPKTSVAKAVQRKVFLPPLLRGSALANLQAIVCMLGRELSMWCLDNTDIFGSTRAAGILGPVPRFHSEPKSS